MSWTKKAKKAGCCERFLKKKHKICKKCPLPDLLTKKEWKKLEEKIG